MKKVLFTGFEFEQTVQRGIYLFTKSLIRAVKANGYSTGILSQANKSYIDVQQAKVFRSLNGDFSHNHRKAVLQYFRLYTHLSQPFMLENKQDLVTSEAFWYLRDIDFFMNFPSFYQSLAFSLRLPLQFTTPNLKFRDLTSDDIVFTTSPLHVKSSKHKIIQTLHDLIPINVMLHGENVEFFYKRLKAFSHADKILAVSEFSKLQFLELFPKLEDRVQVVYQPVPADSYSLRLSSLPKVQEAVLQKFKLKKGQYMYYVGAIEARKNIHRLMEAYKLATNSDKSIPLVLSGSIDDGYARQYGLYDQFVDPNASAKSKGSKNKRNIIKTNYVSEVEKLCLIRNARAFLFPTLNEGFGIPVIEAQTLGVPVLTTNNSSIPEVVGESAYLVDDPYNIEELATGIEKLWADDELVVRLSQKGQVNSSRFSDEQFAQDIEAFLKDI